MKSPLKHLSMAVVIALIAIFALPSVASAATNWYVDPAGNDANGCTSPGPLTACQTIQAAINKASAGDTINVAAGVYTESAPGPLTIGSSLTGLRLLGAQATVDARTRVGAESSIDDSQGTSVGASDVTIDGFTIENSTNQAFTGYGVWLNPGVSGTQVLNNIFQSNIVGLGLANGNGSQALIEHNLFRNNNQSGGASGDGIYTDQFAGGSAVKNVLIEENTFSGNNTAGIDISNTDFAHGVSDLDVSHNSFTANGRALLLFNTHNSSIHDNSITGSTAGVSAAIRLLDNNSKIDILNNDLIGGAGHGIRLSDGVLEPDVPAAPSSDVEIHENNIENYAGDGLLVDGNAHVGTVDATCNWWNSATGPTNANNPGGTGEEVVGDADFAPWLTAPAPNGPCNGLALTPGKVTGGGQVSGDPVFSSNGNLLSAPAIVPSASDPTAQATFGFVVTCCPAKGNLEYTDHAAGVRIKAQSISALNIGTPGTACPATPGSKHATFTGTAKVIRSTGTTTESFTVRVDDCGEPGTMDTFEIQTSSYSNGPTVLIGGNIQIHK